VFPVRISRLSPDYFSFKGQTVIVQERGMGSSITVRYHVGTICSRSHRFNIIWWTKSAHLNGKDWFMFRKVLSLLGIGALLLTVFAFSHGHASAASQVKQAIPLTSSVGCSGSYNLKVTSDGSASCYNGTGNIGVSIYGHSVNLQTRSHSVDFCGYNWVNGVIPIPYCAHVNANSTYSSGATLPYSWLQIDSITIN
jgi:hypothetical protein